MSLSEANLKTYVQQEWNENNAAKPGEVTTDQKLLNHCNKLLIRRLNIDPSWMGGVKQITEMYEARLSHPTKEAGINELIRLLMAYPGGMAGGVTEGFETANPFAVGALSTEQKYAGSKSVKFGRVSPASGWTFTADEVVGATDYIAFAVYMVITSDTGNQTIYVCPSGTTNYFVALVRNASSAYWRVNNLADDVAFVSGNWYLFEFKNIDYTAKTFNLSVNGTHIGNYAFYPASTPTSSKSLAIVNTATLDANISIYMDAFQAGAASALNRAPIQVSKPEYLGLDGDGKHVHSLMFVITRWE